MTKTIKALALLFLLTTGQVSIGQTTNEEKAYTKGREAIKLMDSGEVDKSLILLEEAKKLDPTNIDYPYETAFALHLKKDYKAAVKTLKSLIGHPDVNDKVFQLMGNSYSKNGQRKKAIKTYEDGIRRFPDSGRLHLERGTMELFINEYAKALTLVRKGD
jgi:tetratricopeptide (TPR) repeat protein